MKHKTGLHTILLDYLKPPEFTLLLVFGPGLRYRLNDLLYYYQLSIDGDTVRALQRFGCKTVVGELEVCKLVRELITKEYIQIVSVNGLPYLSLSKKGEFVINGTMRIPKK